MIRVQEQAFDLAQELQTLRGARTDVGGVAIFIGSVRDLSEGRDVSAMTLEHYPGMTEKALSDIEAEARSRWPLLDSLIIHRYGRLSAGEDIVLVITLSAHREAAFAACQFLMDWLKTKAPFWKLEEGAEGPVWVDAKTSDDEAAQRWQKR
jgi:molybdopterin synthase catalytic subunit